MAEPIVELDPSSVKRSILMKNMALEHKETGGNDFLFWKEANAIQSAQKIDALNSVFCTLRGECCKFAVELCIKNGVPEDKKTKAELLAELGFYTEECQVLVEEYVKSAAELCIKKMRLGALVDKCNKQRTLMTEVINTKKEWAEIWQRFAAFRKNLLTSRKQLQQDSHAHVNAEENDLGGAPEKSPEIPRSQIGNLEPGLSNVKFRRRRSVKAVVIRRESFRLMVEMMRGVNKSGQQQDKRLDNAIALGKQWTDAVVRHCLIKLWVGTFVERLSLYEVLKREIAENWKMEKELKDRIVAYQSKHARLAQGSVTKVGRQPKPRVKGGDTIKGEGETSGVGAVVEGEEAVEVKKSEGSSVVEGDEAMKKKKKKKKKKKSEGSSVVEGDEAIKEKNETLKNKRRKTSG